jgi:iron(III) transport system permease protein
MGTHVTTTETPGHRTLLGSVWQRLWSFPVGLRLVLTIAVVVLVIFPFYRLILGSFQTGGPPERGALTLENYRATFDNSSDIIGNTLQFAIGQTVVPLVIGVLLAWVVTRTDVPWRGVWEFSTLGLFFIPLLAAGTAWSILLGGRNGMLNSVIRELTPWDGFDVNSMAGMVFVQSLYLVPLVFLVVGASMRNINADFEDAARISGSSAFGTFVRVNLGVSRPAIASAAVLCFIIGLGSMEIPLLFGFPAREYVFTTDIYSALRVRFPPEHGRASATGVVLLAASMLVLVAYLRSIRHHERFVTVGGKSGRESPVKLGRWRWPVFSLCFAFFFVTMVLPFIAVVVGSLLPFIGRPSTELLSQASLENYRQLNDNPILWRAVKNSLVLSLASAFFVMTFGSLVAYSVVRYRSRWSRWIDYGASLPLMIPAVVLASSLLYSYITLTLPGGFTPWGTLWIMGIAYVVYFLPIATRQMTGPVVQTSVDLEHASRIAGAGNLATMVRIVIPILRPALLGGVVLAFITFMREFTASVLLFRSGTEVISTVMFSFYSNGRLPFVAAISVGLWVASFLLMLFLRFVMRARISF